MIGGNASAEEAAEETEVASKTGFDFELDAQLENQDTIIKKKDYQQWLKNYLKK